MRHAVVYGADRLALYRKPDTKARAQGVVLLAQYGDGGVETIKKGRSIKFHAARIP
jgi:hypothetical protein